MGKSWKTTISGIIAIVLVVGDAANKLIQGQPVDFATLIAGVMAGLGLISAKDSQVTGGTVKQ
jgi:hypothetical protein